MASLEELSDKVIVMEDLGQDEIDLRKKTEEESPIAQTKPEMKEEPEREAEALVGLNVPPAPVPEEEPERTTTNLSDGNRVEEGNENEAAEATSMDIQAHQISPQRKLVAASEIESNNDDNKENVTALLSGGDKGKGQVEEEGALGGFQMPGDWKELVNYLLPAAKKRRRKKSAQNPFTCVSGGVKRSFSSASTLQLHQALHKDSLDPQPESATHKTTTTATNPPSTQIGNNQSSLAESNTKDQAMAAIKSEQNQSNVEGGGDGGGDAGAGVAASRENTNTNNNSNNNNQKPQQQMHLNLPEDLQETAAGQWLELLAADVSGRLGAVRRSRQRIQRGAKEDINSAKSHLGAETEKVETLVAAASGSMLLHMEEQLEKETEVLNKWMTWINEMADKIVLQNSTTQPFGNAMASALSDHVSQRIV